MPSSHLKRLDSSTAVFKGTALKKLDGFEAIILDDLGYVQQSREEMEVLFTFFAERYERRAQQKDREMKRSPDDVSTEHGKAEPSRGSIRARMFHLRAVVFFGWRS